MGRHAVGDLQQGCCPLAHLGMGIAIPDLDQGVTLLRRQLQPSAVHHEAGLLP
jgi:hypothetical protein